MADDEQFSLCWNNFNSNLSAGFHESLCRGDLVDVTLAAEGQFVKAHRLVLSVCSPYFRKMFTQMPANQHAFVFLKDVSHTALKDLIQFMYCGEVNVKQEALPAFISTAEALQIKGLTDSDPSSQSPAEPAAPQPPIPQVTPPRVRQNQRTSSTRSYKIETVDDSLDEKQPTQIVIQTTPSQSTTIAQSQQHLQQNQHHPTQQIASTGTTTTVVTSHKRPAPRTIGTAPHIKRTKSTIDPLEASEPNTQQITVQATVVSADSKVQQQQQHTEAEYIDLPIELPTKSEPDYSEDAGDVDAVENEATYVDDESYGDMRYDESYFTENEEGPSTAAVTGSVGSSSATTSKALVKTQQSLSESSYVEAGDQTNNDAQVIFEYLWPFKTGIWLEKQTLYYLRNQKQGFNLVFHGYMYKKEASFRSTVNWICSNGNGKRVSENKCLARCITKSDDSLKLGKKLHNHPPRFNEDTMPDNLFRADGLELKTAGILKNDVFNAK